MEPPFMSIMFK